jgi:hypothetical protein
MTTPIARGLVAWYRGENNALDSSGNGRHGTWSGTAAYAAGKMGRAWSFARGNKEPRVSFGQQLAPACVGAPAITLAIWFNAVSVEHARQELAIVYGLSTTVALTLRLEGDDLVFGARSRTNETLRIVTVADAIPAAQWVHLAVQADFAGDRLRIWLDAVSVADQAAGFNGNDFAISVGDLSQDESIGNHPSVDERGFGGLIDEVMVWRRALAAREIRAIMATGWPGAAI